MLVLELSKTLRRMRSPFPKSRLVEIGHVDPAAFAADSTCTFTALSSMWIIFDCLVIRGEFFLRHPNEEVRRRGPQKGDSKPSCQ
jgi:hypothetical protein